jgi:hypothetical protein
MPFSRQIWSLVSKRSVSFPLPFDGVRRFFTEPSCVFQQMTATKSIRERAAGYYREYAG